MEPPLSILLEEKKRYLKKYNLAFHLAAIAANGKDEAIEYSPITGVIERILINFSSATGLADVSFFIEEKKILPDNRTVLSLTGTTQKFTVNRPVQENDRIIFKATNNDSSALRIDAVVEITET